MTSIRRLFTLLPLLAAAMPSFSHAEQDTARTRGNLMAIVRESFVTTSADEGFKPVGRMKLKFSNGEEVELDLAAWSFMADANFRFVFKGEATAVSATSRDMADLRLQGMDDALALALANQRRVSGEPRTRAWGLGLTAVEGRLPEFNSTYLLDRAFWNAELEKHPEGLVVAVPSYSELFYVPLADSESVDGLRLAVTYLHKNARKYRVSSALYLFKDGRWSIFQTPAKRRTASGTPAGADVRDEAASK